MRLKRGVVLYKILTNNRLVEEAYPNTEFIDGDFIDVLISARDYAHLGASIVQHPLPASIRMMFSPIRSIIIDTDNPSEKSIIIIESAIEKYNLTMGERKPDYENKEDYMQIDLTLLTTAYGSL